ncbi:hypothetical protein ACTFIW_001709 [Dictyostelium discoideum]
MNSKINLIIVKEKEEQFKILEIIKKEGSKFTQLERAENEIKIGLSIWFVDDIKSPQFIISFELLDALIKIYSNGNIEIAKTCLSSIDWRIGFFLNFPDIDKNELLNKTIHNGAIKYHFQNKIEKLTFIETPNKEIVKIIKKVLTKYKFKVFVSIEYSEYVLKIENEIKLNEKIKELEMNLDGNEIILNYDDIEFANSFWKYKGQFSIEEFKWSSDNGLAFGYKTKTNGGDGDGDGDGKLICWNLIKSDGKTVHLFTLPEYRGKGYALKVKSITLISILKNNLIPLSYINEDNTASQNLSLKLGFKKTLSVQSIEAQLNDI